MSDWFLLGLILFCYLLWVLTYFAMQENKKDYQELRRWMFMMEAHIQREEGAP